MKATLLLIILLALWYGIGAKIQQKQNEDDPKK
jgi:hypothetical protein